jgi:adenylate kinase family enzyme
MQYSEQQLVDKFIERVPINSTETKKLFAIGFTGPTGCGKTTVAKKISEKLNFYIACNDEVKRFLNNLGFEGQLPAPEILNKISTAVLNYLFINKISFIIDADLIVYHESAKEIARSHGAKLYIIEIICPEEIILKRIQKRQENMKINKENGFSLGTVEEYFERKKLHNSLPKPEYFFSINTSLDVDSQVDNLISKLKQEDIL